MCIAGKCHFPTLKGFNLTINLAHDDSDELRGQVLAAANSKTPLNIVGSNSKSFYGRPALGRPLVVNKHSGIINYEPTELVITARCGTRLADITAALNENGQMLPFEPPYFAGDATIGGAIATGLSGPRRPYAGSARDAVLGVKLLDGRGEILKFGGEVMKNVAGFDVSRLMAGALGTLGVLLEISIKVHPLPLTEQTLIYKLDITDALEQMKRQARQNWPLSAACHDGEYLRIRLSGEETAIEAATKQLGGDIMPLEEGKLFWSDLRDQKLAYFQDETPLWRLSLASAAPQPQLSGSWFIDWGGALRWLKTNETPETVFAQAKALGGHACRFRSPQGGAFQPLSPNLEKLHRRLKAAFDPHAIFNPGRMYPDW